MNTLTDNEKKQRKAGIVYGFMIGVTVSLIVYTVFTVRTIKTK